MAESEKKLPGRNDLCHCGSGKKYKACCLDKDEAAAREARQKAQAAAQAAEAEAAPPAGETGAADRPRERDRRHNTDQPWKQKQEARSVPRFNAPRRSGGS
jgi:hypothetical protein